MSISSDFFCIIHVRAAYTRRYMCFRRYDGRVVDCRSADWRSASDASKDEYATHAGGGADRSHCHDRWLLDRNVASVSRGPVGRQLHRARVSSLPLHDAIQYVFRSEFTSMSIESSLFKSMAEQCRMETVTIGLPVIRLQQKQRQTVQNM